MGSTSRDPPSLSDSTTWVEASFGGGAPIDIVMQLRTVLDGLGYATERRGDDVHMGGHGIVATPRGISVERGKDGRVATLSIVFAKDSLGTTDLPIGEWQSGIGQDLGEALRGGLESWGRLDLPVLLDARREKPEASLVMSFVPDPGSGNPARRVLLGPAGFVRDLPDPKSSGSAEEHPFCSCCMFTACFGAIAPLLGRSETLGVRLYALRQRDGITLADCRVNGVDYEAGRVALREYAEKWPDRGFESRKQYVIIQSVP